MSSSNERRLRVERIKEQLNKIKIDSCIVQSEHCNEPECCILQSDKKLVWELVVRFVYRERMLENLSLLVFLKILLKQWGLAASVLCQRSRCGLCGCRTRNPGVLCDPYRLVFRGSRWCIVERRSMFMHKYVCAQ